MAAGSFGVARKRDIHNYPEKESYYYRKNERRREETNRHRNKYSSYLGTVRTCDRRDGGGHGRGFVGRSRDWEPVELLSGWRGGRSRENEISKYEDGVSKPPEKKRKFSPIVWDRDDEGVRLASKNKTFPKFTNGLCCASSLLESFGKLTNVPVTASQLQGFKISPVESHVLDGSVGDCEFEPLPSPTSSTRSEDLGQVGDDEYVEVRHVSASRWARERNSPGNLCLYDSDHCGDYSANKSKRVDDAHADLLDTPESGEFFRGGSECSEGKSPTVSDGSGVSNLDLDLEDDKDSSRFQGSASPKPRRTRMLQDFRSVFAYERVNRINEGTYGVVHKARDKETREIVALKKMKKTGLEGDCYSRVSASREINILASLHHPSVVDVKEVVVDTDDVYLVMEYMEYDLKGFIKAMRQPLSEREVKCLMLKLLEGVKYLHDNWILHRDLKASNLLINSNGDLKICDFGMSRLCGTSLKPYTPLVVTLWYRAPELLLGTKQYLTAIDMWSVGCIMAELLTKQPLFNGDSELEQLNKIFGILGTPSETIWPGFSKLPGAKVKFAKQSRRNTLREKFPGFSFWGSPVLSDQGFDLLSRLLTYDPEKRISAEAALKHNWFQVESEQELASVQESIACTLKLMTNGK